MRPRAQRSGFLVKTVGDQLVVFDQSRQHLHVLSRTAAVVWSHCDGQRTVAELIDLVGRELGAPVDESMITLALAQLDEARLLEDRLVPAPGEESLSRRDLLQRAGALAAGIMLPTITSCGVPTEPMSVAAASFSTGESTSTTPLFTTTTSTTPLFTTTTTSTTPLFTTTTTSTTPAFTTTTTSTTPLFTTTTTSTTPLFTTTTTSTTPAVTTTTSTTTTPPPKKVAMCHKGRTIMVDESAVPAHLAHGDTLGQCPQ